MKRTAILLVLVVLLAAGGFALRDRIARLIPGTATSSDVAPPPPGAATTQGGPLVPPAVASREALTQDLAATEARVMAAVQQGTRSGAADPPAELDRLFEALRQLHGQIPRDHFDPAAIVAAVGPDPIALATWVNDHTSLVPYHGTLRGAVGVLMDRHGNSLDRALLLDDLLRKAGRDTRLARTQVAGAALDAVVAAAARPLVNASGAGDAAPGGDTPENIVKRAGIDPTAVAAEQTAWRNARRKLGDDTATRARAQAAALLTAVTPHIAAPAVDETAWRREALADHWFVQYRDGADWVALDAVPGRPSFEPLAAAAATMAATALPGEVRHRVRVRVVAEYWKDGTLQPAIALDEVFAPSTVLGQAVSLRTLPTNWPSDGALRAAADPQRALMDAALAQHAWTPILVLGTRPIFSRSFTDDGRLVDPTLADDATAELGRKIGALTNRTVGGATGMLGSLPSGEPPPAAPAAAATSPVFTAQWIEYEILAPGLPVESLRREVFDLLPADQRALPRPPRPTLTDQDKLQRALALINEIDLLPIGAQLHPEYVTALRASRLLAARTYITQAVADRDRNATPPDSLQPLPGPLMDVALARSA